MRIACLVMTLGWFAAAFAADETQPAKSPKQDPTFLAGGALTMPEVTGETVFAAAGTMDLASVKVENMFATGGTITLGDVSSENLLAAGGTVTVKATEVENARLAGGTVTFSGKITEDLAIGGGAVTVAPGSTIDGELKIESGKVDFAGTVGGKTRIEAQMITISGEFGDDAELSGTNVTIAPGTVFKGDLSLPRVVNFTLPDGVTVAGETKVNRARASRGDRENIRREVSEAIERARREAGGEERAAQGDAANRAADDDFDLFSPDTLSMSAWLTVLLTLGACGALALAVAPQFVARSAQRLTQAPLESLLVGAGSLVAVPVLLVVIGVTVIGIPFAVLGAAAYAIGIGLGLIALCLWGGLMVRTIANQPGEETRLSKLVGWTLMGFLALALIGTVPWVGPMIQALAVTAGAGAVLATAWHARKQKTAVAA